MLKQGQGQKIMARVKKKDIDNGELSKYNIKGWVDQDKRHIIHPLIPFPEDLALLLCSPYETIPNQNFRFPKSKPHFLNRKYSGNGIRLVNQAVLMNYFHPGSHLRRSSSECK